MDNFGIDILYEEHDNIIRFTGYLRELCKKMMNGENVDKEALMDCVSFIKVYADDHHHGKEEAILFKVMLEKLGMPANKMINLGMMVEHNLGRYHVDEMEKAVQAMSDNPTMDEKLDVITHMLSYVDLLRRHAHKENNVLFPFAARSLSEDDMEKVTNESRVFEKNGEKNGVRKYNEWLSKVCKPYNL